MLMSLLALDNLACYSTVNNMPSYPTLIEQYIYPIPLDQSDCVKNKQNRITRFIQSRQGIIQLGFASSDNP